MTFDQAQTEFQRIIRSINKDSSPEELLQAQLALSRLKDQLRTRDGFDSLLTSINEVYDNLPDAITARGLAELQLRDEIFIRASSKFDEISAMGRRSAKLLSLEKAKMAIPVLNESAEEIRGIIKALRNDNSADAIARAQSLLAVVEKVRDNFSQSDS